MDLTAAQLDVGGTAASTRVDDVATNKSKGARKPTLTAPSEGGSFIHASPLLTSQSIIVTIKCRVHGDADRGSVHLVLGVTLKVAAVSSSSTPAKGMPKVPQSLFKEAQAVAGRKFILSFTMLVRRSSELTSLTVGPTYPSVIAEDGSSVVASPQPAHPHEAVVHRREQDLAAEEADNGMMFSNSQACNV